MLEYDYNSLDDDFVTVWSKYIITQDVTVIIDDLETLAEKGQINAVQSWYLFRKPGENAKIDYIVSTYRGESYNELLAMAHYHQYDEDFEDQFNQINEVLKMYQEETDNHMRKQFELNLESRWLDIRQTKHFEYYRDAMYKANDALKNQGIDASAKERAVEVGLAFVFNIQMKVNYINSLATKNGIHFSLKAKKILKMLIKEYKQEKSKNPNFSPKDNPRLAYSLGKAYVFYGKTDKNKSIGYSILKQLSERELAISKSANESKTNTVTQQKSVADKLFDKVFNEVMGKQNSNDDTIEK